MNPPGIGIWEGLTTRPTGLLALPGGFVNEDETFLQAAIREVREETGLKVPVPVLLGSIKDDKLFDHPDRSQRGRTATVAQYITLNPGPLPKVKGADDADPDGTGWYPLHEILESEERIFEDHASIIKYFV